MAKASVLILLSIFVFGSLGASIDSDIFKVIDEDDCKHCVDVIAHLKELIDSGASKEEIMKELIESCEDYGTGYGGLCEELVGENWELFLYVMKFLTPEAVCTFLVPACPVKNV